MRIFYFFIAMLITSQLLAQNVGIGTTAPDPSAMLDIVAKDKGLLIPRLTTVQRTTAVISPATGLLVYDTDTNSFWYYNGAAWIDLSGAGAGNAWLLTGNSGTDPAVNFIGTTDNQPMVFKINSQRNGWLGNSNVFWGINAGFSNTSISNVGIGTAALYNNTTNGYLVAIGDSALFNNGIGATRLIHAAANTAIGAKALLANTIGHYNTAIGTWTLQTNTTGTHNTAIGPHALENNTDGASNTAIAAYSLWDNTTGYFNTATGRWSLEHNTTGAYNTATGVDALNHNITGNYNVGIGYHANVASANLVNAVAIGSRAQVSQDNSMVLGSIRGVNFATADTKVGIGITNPSERLHVVGNARVDGEVNRQSTGAANLVPVCYGSISATGTINSGSGNFTVSRTSAGNYSITITGETYHYLRYTTTVTPAGVSTPMVTGTNSVSGNLRVFTYNLSGAATDSGFSFVVHKQ